MPPSKNVFKYSMEGEYLAEYDSLSEAGGKNKIKYNGIAKCTEGIYRFSGKYVWRYYKKKKIKVDLEPKYFRKPVLAVKGSRKIEFRSTQEAADFIGCHRTSISQALNKKHNRKTVCGWVITQLKS